MTSIFKSLKDARRRAVETVLATVGVSEETVDEEFNVHHKKFMDMVGDLNECGATLDAALDKQQQSFEVSLMYVYNACHIQFVCHVCTPSHLLTFLPSPRILLQ